MTRAPEFTEAKVYLSNGQSIIQVCHFIINDLSSVCKNYDRCFLLENLYFWTLFRLSSTLKRSKTTTKADFQKSSIITNVSENVSAVM